MQDSVGPSSSRDRPARGSVMVVCVVLWSSFRPCSVSLAFREKSSSEESVSTFPRIAKVF